MHVIKIFFSWPDGGVWSNVVASLLWAVPGFVCSHVLLKKHHAKKTQEQTDELKEHVTAVVKEHVGRVE